MIVEHQILENVLLLKPNIYKDDRGYFFESFRESIFKKNGIESIECINKKFDPNFHQAMLEVEDNTKNTGTVVQEMQKGYMMKDRLLRPSLVGVAKKREEKEEKEEKK